jgi:hypothetical protein
MFYMDHIRKNNHLFSLWWLVYEIVQGNDMRTIC